MKIILAPRGTKRHEVELREITVPDLWHLQEELREANRLIDADAVLETWHLALDLIWNLEQIARSQG